MKRKDTSRLLNEWKSFLNESKIDKEFINSLSDEDRNALNVVSDNEVNEDKRAIFSALHVMGLDDKDIVDVTIGGISLVELRWAASKVKELVYFGDLQKRIRTEFTYKLKF